MVGFIFGGDTGETLESLKRKRSVAEALLARSSRAPQNVGEGLSAIGNAILYRSLLGDVEKGEAQGEASAANDRAGFYSGYGMDAAATPPATKLPGSGVADELNATSPAIDVADNDIYSPFIETVKAGGLQNPYGLAAVAATGKAESGWSPKKANASWSDPSESGQAGTSGGILSWRADRLQNLYNFASSKGEKPGAISPQTQAEFFLKEDPQLVAKLNSAKSPEEAADLMANAWKFAGYDRPGGEAARRRSYVNAYLPKFRVGNEVASLDPSAGMAPAAAAIEAQAPTSGAVAPETAASAYVDPRVSAPNYNPDAPLPQASLPRQEAGAVLPPVPGRTVGPSPVVAALAGDPSAPRQISPVAAALAAPAPAGAGALPVSEMGSTTGRTVVAPGGRNTAVAQALAGKDYFPAAPNAPGQSGPSIQQAIQLLNNPYASQTDKAMASEVVERAQRARDPAYQLELETKRAQLDALRSKPTKQWQKLTDTLLFNPETGETKDITGTPPGAKPAFRFTGSSVDAQALNGLMDSGALTPDQAQQLAAGKTITGPNGEIIFLTPSGIFGKPANGGPAQPITPPAAGAPAAGAPAAAPGQGAAVTAPPASAAPAAAQPGGGNITLTAPKVTIDESKAAGFADRMTQSGTLIDKFGNAGLSTVDQALTDNAWVPDVIANNVVGDDFQQFAQARRDFINAQLRRESGAVISPEEFANANKQYFPMPGDRPEVLEQKRKNRETVINAMVRDAGPTYGKDKPKKPDLGEAPDFSKMSDEELRRYLDGK